MTSLWTGVWEAMVSKISFKLCKLKRSWNRKKSSIFRKKLVDTTEQTFHDIILSTSHLQIYQICDWMIQKKTYKQSSSCSSCTDSLSIVFSYMIIIPWNDTPKFHEINHAFPMCCGIAWDSIVFHGIVSLDSKVYWSRSKLQTFHWESYRAIRHTDERKIQRKWFQLLPGAPQWHGEDR